MGEAKRRGTKEQRIAQSIERQAREAAERSAELKARRHAEAARISALPPQERKEAVLAGSGHVSRAMLAAMLGVAAPLIAAERNDDISETR